MFKPFQRNYITLTLKISWISYNTKSLHLLNLF